MQYYPICLDLRNKKCLVIGGGNVAVRKAENLLEAGAKVKIVAPEIKQQPLGSSIELRPFQEDDLNEVFLTIIATSNNETNKRIATLARKRGVLTNVVDDKENSDFIVPSIVKRDPLFISISTSGVAPGLSKQIRKDLEKQYGEGYKSFLNILSKYRGQIISNENKDKIWMSIISECKSLANNKACEKDVKETIEGIINETK